LILLAVAALSFAAEPPSDFRKTFNGRDLTGWHISQTNSHGNTRAWTVKSGVLSGAQNPTGNGGILLTDRKYHNFEISLEVQPDYGCDGGLLLRSTEKGEAYQVMLDYLDGGNIGGIYGEGLARIEDGSGARMNRDWEKYWKRGDWNRIRARIEGEIPHIQVWLNDTRIVDWTDTQNRLPNGATEGFVALQVHRNSPDWKSQRWTANGVHRFRNIAIRELQ
ncbi:MAG: DUF1080 domain-containing protein, partial [Bryobacteraceae bacterium]|nr:DUF1080 domain-containing protein [Bryobacteraceae bacterium]